MNVRRSLSSANALSVWVPLIPSVLLGVNVVAAPYENRPPSLHLVVTVVSAVAAISVVLAARPLVGRIRTSTARIVGTLMVYALAGAAHGGAVLIIVVGFGYVTALPQGFALGLGVRVVSAIAWLSLMAIVLDEARLHRATMRSLRARVDELRRAQEVERQYLNDILQSVRHDAVAPVLEALGRFRVALEPLAGGQRQAESALRLGRLIEKQVRTLGHNLMRGDEPWRSPAVEEYSVPLAERIRHVLRTVSARPFHRPLVAAALYQGTVTLFFLTTGESLLLIGGNAVLGFANLAVGALLANRFLTPHLERCSIPLRLLVGTGAAVLIAFTGITLFALLSALLGGGPVWVWTVLVSWPVVAALFALAAGLEAERREQEAHLETLGRELAWSTAHVAQRVRHERRLLGAWLHGPTQSALLALVRRLENALPGQLEEVVEAALPDLLTVTESIQHLIDGRDTEPLILDDALGNIVKMWRGALEVRIVDEPAVAERLQADPAALTVAVDVVAEGLANASRHGRAHRAEVTLEQVEGSRLIVITVTDDGMYGGNGEPGGGSAFLDQVATSWTIRSIEAGKTELRVVIPCGGPAESGSEYAIGRPLDVSSPLVLD